MASAARRIVARGCFATLVFALWFTVDGVYEVSSIFATAGLGIYLVLRRVKPMLIQEDDKPIEGATPAKADPRT